MEELTKTRKEMMEILGVSEEKEYIKKIEYIAWWYIFASTENYTISAKRKCGPIQEEELELPLKIESR